MSEEQGAGAPTVGKGQGPPLLTINTQTESGQSDSLHKHKPTPHWLVPLSWFVSSFSGNCNNLPGRGVCVVRVFVCACLRVCVCARARVCRCIMCPCVCACIPAFYVQDPNPPDKLQLLTTSYPKQFPVFLCVLSVPVSCVPVHSCLCCSRPSVYSSSNALSMQHTHIHLYQPL